jgi:enoyl-CoA hydratase
MTYENVRLDIADRVATLTVDRPKVLNALNRATLVEIGRALDAVRPDPNVAVVVVTGGGEKAFVAGADIAEMRDLAPSEARAFARLGQGVFRSIERMDKPVIAAINGYALGGGLELALACDIRIASEKARLGQPEVALGVTPGFGGTQRLARLVGPAAAKLLLFTGETIGAAEALRIGLVNEVVPPEALADRVRAIATTIASRGPVAVGLVKAAVDAGLQVDIDRGAEIEADLFGLAFSTEDRREGMVAFLEKRPAVFKGR